LLTGRTNLLAVVVNDQDGVDDRKRWRPFFFPRTQSESCSRAAEFQGRTATSLKLYHLLNF